EATGATVDIDDTGKVSVFAVGIETLNKTVEMINAFVKDVEIGQIYKGKVVSIQKFGAFMEILPGKDGLLHVSEISNERVANVEDVLKVGDEFEVKVIGSENGKISLSKKKV
ncbi:MAG: S1 RNA-binding domain-containing protein, partial [Fusobacteriaceae bacterium]